MKFPVVSVTCLRYIVAYSQFFKFKILANLFSRASETRALAADGTFSNLLRKCYLVVCSVR